MRKKIYIIKPGLFGNFFYYFFEIMNTLMLLFFITALSILTVMYFWAMIDEASLPMRLYDRSGGPWSFFYQIQSIAGMLFLWLFVFMLRKNLTDLFSKKESIVLKIDKKGIDHTGNRLGSSTYYLGGKGEYFTVTAKAFKALNEGQVIKINYTKAQKNVRSIQLLK